MSTQKQYNSGYGPVYDNSASIAALLRSAANPNRVRVLSVVMKDGAEFSEMAEATDLSRTALANHVSQLMRNGLMRRVSRGRYELTADGRDLLSAAFLTYRRSSRRAGQEKDMMKKSYDLAYGQQTSQDGRIISSDAKYESCWLSLLGAISGSLNALGTRASVVDVGGYTGYSFLVNVSKNETCPSGPTALHVRTFEEILAGVECLGWRVQNRELSHGYPSIPGTPSVEDLKVARGVFQRIRREIEKRDRPVVLYGLVAPEYGIVRGYTGDSYLVSTFRGLQNPDTEEEPVPYYKLNAPGCIDEIYFVRRIKIRPARARNEALARSLRFAEGDVETMRGYLCGPSAFVEWARVLEELPEDSQNYMGNSYVGACVQEGRALSSAFLRKVAKKTPVSQSRHLNKASSCYSRGARSLEEFTKLFPFRFEGKMPARKRKRGASLLRDVHDHEERAIQHLRRVV